MLDFTYQARDAQGELQSGTLAAQDLTAAVRELAGQGLELISIRRVNVDAESLASTTNRPHGPVDDTAQRRLTEVIERRKLWLPAIDSQLQEFPQGLARRATALRIERISGAMTVEQFLQNVDAVELLPLLNSDEQPTPSSPYMRAWLQRIYQDQQRQLHHSRRWSYPLLLLAIGLALLVGWGTFVLPLFRDMFDDFGLSLPAPTKLVFWVSDQLTVHAWRTLLWIAAGCAVMLPVVRWWRARAMTNRLFGPLVTGTTGNLRAMSRMAGTLAELLGLQLPLASALSYSGKASGHPYFAEAAKRAAEVARVDSAKTAPAFDPSGRLPPSFVYALTADAAGEPSVAMLRELAMIYGQIAQSRQDRLRGNLPVFGVVVLGLIIGFVVISLFMPLVSMITSLA